MDEQERVERVYDERGYDRDPQYADSNPVYLHRVQSIERECLRALVHAVGPDRLPESRVLDYGCGNGRWLGRWLAWGVRSENLAGADIRGSAVRMARAAFPACDIRVTSEWGGTAVGSFDIVSAILVFSSILDDGARVAAAQGMSEMVADDGVLMICDFRVGNPSNPNVRPLTVRDARALFPGFHLLSSRKVVLAPPIARRLVPTSWAMATLLESLVPAARTHRVFVMRRSAG